MQKWEYCVIEGLGWDEFSTFDRFSLCKLTGKGLEVVATWETIRKSLPKGSKLTSEHAAAQFIAQLGEEGWEMAGVDGGGSAHCHCLYFKRPKA